MYEEQKDEPYAKGISKINYTENFKYFIENIKEDKPFFFWFGAYEPHRVYEKDSWKKMGKKLADVKLPEFLPDNDAIRGDILDYAVEIEWFDLHLQRMLEYLEKIGELENTIIIVTSDNGMPFPRAKANSYEYGVHVPFAIRYPKEFPGNRVVNDPVGFIDIAPTILEITKTSSEGMLPITGKSLLDILTSKESGLISKTNRTVFSGRERHTSARYLNRGYPQRSIRKGDYLFIWNMNPERWPAGAPQRFDNKNTSILLDMYGLDEHGKYVSAGVFADIGESPTKTYLIENHNSEEIRPFFDLACEKRPEFELYNVDKDSDCIKNLVHNPAYKTIEDELKQELIDELKRTKDPRIVGPIYDIFDNYKRYMNMRKFPKP